MARRAVAAVAEQATREDTVVPPSLDEAVSGQLSAIRTASGSKLGVTRPDYIIARRSPEGLAAVRRYLGCRFPALRDAPVVEARVCQYENTSSGDFLLDRHSAFDNGWLSGGGSGHGFKHGPAVGEYLVGGILDGAPAEPRFSLV